MAKKAGTVEPNEPARAVGSPSFTPIALLLVAAGADLHAQSRPAASAGRFAVRYRRRPLDRDEADPARYVPWLRGPGRE
ncbi:MAG TPA: hypothetical protein VFW15_08385 [Thermoanaerobaculia bacterium]|nr:hypothetical protein [Thermoanaerobaculia bacterium]